MISFQNVSFTYAESRNGGVLDLNLIVRSGECVLLCGPSGCGKTTVTRLTNGLIPHFFHGNLSGQVNVNGMDTRETEIAALSDAVGTVFQNPRTQFFNTDTDSEIVFGLENRGIPREALRSRLDELTEELHFSELRGRNIFELSGGEKQKIAFSSVYASAPDVLVFDEPSSNLDMKAIGELADLIQRAKISGKTILIAEHRIWYLMDIVDRVVYMQDGRIASDMETSAFKALPEADIRRMGLRVRDLSVSESGGVKTIAADGLLSVQKISVRLGGRNVLNDISFQASRGEIIAIAGVNGAGKSTLARMLCGLQKNGSGTVLWSGKPMSRRLRRKKAYMVMQDKATLHASREDYLEAILVLQKQKGMVRSVDVARHMEVSKPSVSRAVTTLKEGGFLTMDDDFFLHLTDLGWEVAEQTYEKHRFFTNLLTEAGVAPKTAERDACRMEHVISQESFRCLRDAYKAKKE